MWVCVAASLLCGPHLVIDAAPGFGRGRGSRQERCVLRGRRRPTPLRVPNGSSGASGSPAVPLNVRAAGRSLPRRAPRGSPGLPGRVRTLSGVSPTESQAVRHYARLVGRRRDANARVAAQHAADATRRSAATAFWRGGAATASWLEVAAWERLCRSGVDCASAGARRPGGTCAALGDLYCVVGAITAPRSELFGNSGVMLVCLILR